MTPYKRSKGNSDQRSAGALEWRKLHHSRLWRRLRRMHLYKDPLCLMCSEEGRISAASVVDHIIPHKGDEALFYDQNNWQSLCSHHHSSVKQSDERSTAPRRGADGWPIERHKPGEVSHPAWFTASRVPLTIVCGPPASGKSTYVAQHKGPHDTVIDLDAIALAAHGIPAAMLTKAQRIACLTTRNKQLGILMKSGAALLCDHAWLIVSEPTASKRQWWQDKLKPVNIVVIETPVAECIARAKADTKQQRPAQVAQSIAGWWQTYTKRAEEQAISPASHAENT